MNLDAALSTIADRFGLDAAELQRYAAEDTIGGYSPNTVERKWDTGSIFGVEGQVLYALIRATKPHLALNLGGWRGCSTAHMASALAADGSGKLITVDLSPQPEQTDYDNIEYITGDAVDYMAKLAKNKVDLVFEDIGHSEAETRAVWETVLTKGRKGAWIISHDNLHPLAGKVVTDGIRAAGVSDALALLIEPSDCGLAIYHKD